MSEYDESDTYSSSGVSDYSDDVDPPWQDGVSENGELFYVEQDQASQIQTLSEGGTQHTRADNDVHNNDLHGTASNSYQRRPNRESNNRQNQNIKWQSEANLKTVFISVNSAVSYNPAASLLKEMIGIISLSKTNGGRYFGKNADDKYLVVNAMLPDGPAFKSEAVEVGDILLAVSDVAVYHSNIEQVLQRIPHRMELKLTIQHEQKSVSFDPMYGQEYNQTSVPVSLHPLNRLSQLESETDDANLGIFNAVLYLTLNVDSETAQGEEDIRYLYPASDNPGIRKLKSIRGIFTTLADVTKDAFKSEIVSSSLFINNELIHCAYFHHNFEVLIICMPSATCPLSSVHNILTKTVRLLKLMFGSLVLAFEGKNWSRLNDMFQILFKSSIWSSASPEFSLAQSVDGIRSLKLDEEIVVGIDIALTELEAADFDDGFHSQGLARRLYTILGSCLFYKGYLVADHLPKEDLKDIWTYCQIYALLKSHKVGQLLIWREVFPTRSRRYAGDGDFKETDGRYFYLLVGLRHCLLCVLVESGGCTVPTTGRAGPPLLYINHAKAAILHLENINIPRKIDEILLSQSFVPQLSSADTLVKKPGSSLFSGTPQNKPPSGSDQTTNQTTDQGSIKLPVASPSKIDTAKENTGRQVNTQNSRGSLVNRLGSPKLDSSVLSKGVKALSSTFITGKLKPTTDYSRLTSGNTNTLFHYVHFDTISGMLLNPLEESLSTLHDPFHRCILESFHYHALVLHERLSSQHMKNPNQKLFEEGTLFHCHLSDFSSSGNKKAKPYVQYWIIGRTITKPKLCEFYVCFHDSVKEDMKEMAFRMGFGVAL